MELCSFSLELLDRDPAQVERQNLVNLCKLIVKELIDSSVQYGRQLDSDFLSLQRSLLSWHLQMFQQIKTTNKVDD